MCSIESVKRSRENPYFSINLPQCTSYFHALEIFYNVYPSCDFVKRYSAVIFAAIHDQYLKRKSYTNQHISCQFYSPYSLAAFFSPLIFPLVYIFILSPVFFNVFNIITTTFSETTPT